MTKHKYDEHGDEALGMITAVTRRDFLGSTLLASGAMLLEGFTPAELFAQATDDFTGYGCVGEYSNSNGNTWPLKSDFEILPLGRNFLRHGGQFPQHCDLQSCAQG